MYNVYIYLIVVVDRQGVVDEMVCVLCADGCYVRYNWRWCISKSSCLTEDNLCDVAVIDGGTLYVSCSGPAEVRCVYTCL